LGAGATDQLVWVQIGPVGDLAQPGGARAAVGGEPAGRGVADPLDQAGTARQADEGVGDLTRRRAAGRQAAGEVEQARGRALIGGLRRRDEAAPADMAAQQAATLGLGIGAGDRALPTPRR